MSIPCYTKEELEHMAYILKALAHPNRLMIVGLLASNEELNVSDLCERIGCSQALVSHHLTDMQAKGILSIRRDGRNAFYSLADDRMMNIMKCMMQCKEERSGA